MNTNDENNYLSHHGIKGMKWGVRRTPEQLGHRISSGVKKAKSKVISSKNKKKKQSDDVKNMSDEELRRRINRIQMEKQYKQLTKKEISPGQKFAKDVVVGAAKQTAQQYASKAMTKGVEALLKAAMK